MKCCISLQHRPQLPGAVLRIFCVLNTFSFCNMSKGVTQLTQSFWKSGISGAQNANALCFPSTCRYLLRVRADGSHELAEARDSRHSALLRNPSTEGGSWAVFILFLSAKRVPQWARSQKRQALPCSLLMLSHLRLGIGIKADICSISC